MFEHINLLYYCHPYKFATLEQSSFCTYIELALNEVNIMKILTKYT